MSSAWNPAIFCLLLCLVGFACASPCKSCFGVGMKPGPCVPNVPTRILFRSPNCDSGDATQCFQAGTWNSCTNGTTGGLMQTFDQASRTTRAFQWTSPDCSGEPFSTYINYNGVCWNNLRLRNSYVDLLSFDDDWSGPVSGKPDTANPIPTIVCITPETCAGFKVLEVSFSDANCKNFTSALPVFASNQNFGQCLFSDSPFIENHVYSCDGQYLTDYTYSGGCHTDAPKSVKFTQVGVCLPDLRNSKMIVCSNGTHYKH